MNEKSIGYSKVYKSETEKVRHRIVRYIEEVGPANCLDIGCGNDKLTINGIGIDGRKLDGVDYVTKNLGEIYKLSEIMPATLNGRSEFGIVYSSHVLEHLEDYDAALNDWKKLIWKDGYLILYLPDDDHYNNDSNPEHIHRFRYQEFVDRFAEVHKDMEIVESDSDVGFDRYSFYLVARRRG